MNPIPSSPPATPARAHRRGLRRTGAAAVAVLAVGAVAACSSGKSSPTTTASAAPAALSQTGGAAAPGAGGSGTTSAAALVELASKGPILGPTTGVVAPSALHAATAADIKPFAYKPLGKPEKVAILVASPNAAGLDQLGAIMVAALAKLHIGAQQFFGDFSPTGDQAAMNSALASNPSAIVLVSVPPATLSAQVAAARSRRIPVIDGTSSEAVDGPGLDGYVSESFNMVQILQAAYIVAHGGPTAESVWLTLPTFPAVETSAGLAYLHTVCSGCKVSQSAMTLSQEVSPVAFGQLVTSTIRAHPAAAFITTPAACIPLSAAHSALKQAGSRALFTSGGCTSTALGAMNAGYLPYVSTTSESWNGLADVDQVLRVLSGQPPAGSSGPGAFLITKANEPTSSVSPTGGEVDRWLLKRFDFASVYGTAWGVDLSSIFAAEH